MTWPAGKCGMDKKEAKDATAMPGPSIQKLRRRGTSTSGMEQRALAHAALTTRGATEEFINAAEDVETLRPSIIRGLLKIGELDARNERHMVELKLYFPRFREESDVRRKIAYNKIKLETIPRLVARADHKVNIATSLEEMARRCLRATEQGLARAKEHLETMTPGITAEIEEQEEIMNREREKFHNKNDAVVKRWRGCPPKPKRPIARNNGVKLAQNVACQLIRRAKRTTIAAHKKMKKQLGTRPVATSRLRLLRGPQKVKAAQQKWSSSQLRKGGCDNGMNLAQHEPQPPPNPNIPGKDATLAKVKLQQGQKIMGTEWTTATASTSSTSSSFLNAQKTIRMLKRLGVDSGSLKSAIIVPSVLSILSEESKGMEGRVTRSTSKLRPANAPSPAQALSTPTSALMPWTVDSKLELPLRVQLTRLENEDKENIVERSHPPAEVKTVSCSYDLRKSIKSVYRRPQEEEKEKPQRIEDEDASSMVEAINDSESTDAPGAPTPTMAPFTISIPFKSEITDLYDVGADPQTYCFCGKTSFGPMIACDGETCPYQWFHYPCIGMEVAPVGEWYCPDCSPPAPTHGKKGRRGRGRGSRIFLKKKTGTATALTKPRPPESSMQPRCCGCCLF